MCPRVSQGTQWERSCQHSEHAFPLLQTNLRSLTLVPPVAFSAPFPFSSFSMGPHGDYPLQVFKRRWMGSQLSQKASSKGWESQSSVKLPTQGGLRILWHRERTVLLHHWTGTARSRAGTPARINSSVLVSEAAQFGKRCLTLFHAPSGNPENPAPLQWSGLATRRICPLWSETTPEARENLHAAGAPAHSIENALDTTFNSERRQQPVSTNRGLAV